MLRVNLVKIISLSICIWYEVHNTEEVFLSNIMRENSNSVMVKHLCKRPIKAINSMNRFNLDNQSRNILLLYFKLIKQYKEWTKAFKF
jgi:hypothetical protein